MTSKQVAIYTTNKIVEAELIKQHLANNGIEAFLLNKMDSAYHFGEVEILVSEEEIIRSKKLVEDFLKDE
jgi:hypothetical protein